MQDWIIRPKLRTVRGTAEINSWGGYEKQYQVRIDPNRLVKHGLTFDEVVRAVEQNNRNDGVPQATAASLAAGNLAMTKGWVQGCCNCTLS